MNGDWVENDEGIANAAISYFSNLFSKLDSADSGMLHLIPSLITREDNMALEEYPSMEEVKRAVFGMDGTAQRTQMGLLTGFIKGRSITENFLLVQEIIMGIRKKARGGNVALKLDMSKAYDRCLSMAYPVASLNLVEVCVKETSLSPALFVIGAEVTYLAFADDVIIFANSSSKALKLIMHMLAIYQRASGQLINTQKCGYLMHFSMPAARRRVVECLTGFSRQHFPVRLHSAWKMGYPSVGAGVDPGNHFLHLQAGGPKRGTGRRGSLDADDN
ncbi:uncharacterized protein [Coffea arabica]|uniref:Reverse transcriptase domain-containing protein n=1 Tax=Coffea arabica TaxID=13443 RepID=A0ABM4X7B0_COFAR